MSVHADTQSHTKRHACISNKFVQEPQDQQNREEKSVRGDDDGGWRRVGRGFRSVLDRPQDRKDKGKDTEKKKEPKENKAHEAHVHMRITQKKKHAKKSPVQ